MKKKNKNVKEIRVLLKLLKQSKSPLYNTKFRAQKDKPKFQTSFSSFKHIVIRAIKETFYLRQLIIYRKFFIIIFYNNKHFS